MKVAAVFAALAVSPACALDGEKPSDLQRIPARRFDSAADALRAGLSDFKSGNTRASIAALSYAAEGGEPLAQWKLGRIYARGEGVPRDDLKAYHYFNKLVEAYNEDEPNRRNASAISNAFVSVGVYCLSGISGSEVRPDPERALEMFQFAATNFRDSDAQYHLGRMYLDGAGGLPKNNMRAARWLFLAAEKGQKEAQATLGHLLFVGEGVPQQRARGLMWLSLSKGTAVGARDEWIRDLYARDIAAASDDDRAIASNYLAERARNPAGPEQVVEARGRIFGLPLLPPLHRVFGAGPAGGFVEEDIGPPRW